MRMQYEALIRANWRGRGDLLPSEVQPEPRRLAISTGNSDTHESDRHDGDDHRVTILLTNVRVLSLAAPRDPTHSDYIYSFTA